MVWQKLTKKKIVKTDIIVNENSLLVIFSLKYTNTTRQNNQLSWTSEKISLWSNKRGHDVVKIEKVEELFYDYNRLWFIIYSKRIFVLY